ncbi:Alpha/Beta hydrolase protein [Panaeolus papilionaceus]|nr:Alpha/Beta hydrolase protein [Panaeolus papilionaceus]
MGYMMGGFLALFTSHTRNYDKDNFRISLLEMSPPIELVFKNADGIDIMMDVYIPKGATKENPAPVFLWWHGGGLLQGSRKAVASHMLSAVEKHNLVLISPDYRLAPQTRIPGIYSDCLDALSFLSSPTFHSATSQRVDNTRIVLSGSSAGGWLSLLLGTGIGASVPQRPVSYMDRVITREEVATYLDPNSEKTAFCALDSKRLIFYHYMVQEAILSSLLLGDTGIPEIAFSIAPSLLSNLYAHLPPAYIITGNQDGKVPHQQSLDVVAALESLKSSGKIGNLRVEYVERDGDDHSFDKEEGFDEAEMDGMYRFFKDVVV